MAIKFLNKTNANDISVVQNRLAVGGDFTPQDVLHVRGNSNQSMGFLDKPSIRLEDLDTSFSTGSVTFTNNAGFAQYVAPLQHRFYLANQFTNEILAIVNSSTGASRQGGVGVLTDIPYAALDVRGGIKMANDSDVASIDKAGTMRYRETTSRGENVSLLEMCMRIDDNNAAETHRWVIIQENVW